MLFFWVACATVFHWLMQVIKLLHHAFEAAGLGLYLRPYGCLPTGYECGIIEVVPNTKSRAALGELSDRGLHDIFAAEFGAPGSPAFERARENFIVSEAAYAVASYLLQVSLTIQCMLVISRIIPVLFTAFVRTGDEVCFEYCSLHFCADFWTW